MLAGMPNGLPGRKTQGELPIGTAHDEEPMHPDVDEDPDRWEAA